MLHITWFCLFQMMYFLRLLHVTVAHARITDHHGYTTFAWVLHILCVVWLLHYRKISKLAPHRLLVCLIYTIYSFMSDHFYVNKLLHRGSYICGIHGALLIDSAIKVLWNRKSERSGVPGLTGRMCALYRHVHLSCETVGAT